MLRVIRIIEFTKTTVRSFSTLGKPLYSGHNKWSTIKHDKFKNDAKKNKNINKFVSRIMLAVKLKDTKLPQLIETAMKNNVPKKVIDNAIKTGEGIGSNGSSNGETNIYEGIAPGGVAIIIETQTDNKNRTVALVRSHFNKANLNLTSMGSCMHYFNKFGKIDFHDGNEEGKKMNEDDIYERILEIDGIDDFKEVKHNEIERNNECEDENDNGNENIKIYCALTEPSLTNKIALKIQDKGFELDNTSIGYFPKEETKVVINDTETRESFRKFLNSLRDIDDVVNVYSNEV